MDDPFKTFIKDMLNSKTWSPGVDTDAKALLEEDLQTRLMDQIDQAVVEALPEDKVDGLNALLDREAPDNEVQQYIASSGVDIQRVTTETMLRFRDLYIGSQNT
ncbi:MAG: hypothetical protein ABI397_00010 [Candidatus Saccharimonas sp.]